MFFKISALAILTLCLLVEQSVQEECVPQRLALLRLHTNHILTWTVNPNEPCRITEFLVYIFHPQQPAEYAFSVNGTFVDASFLEVCEEWILSVIPISGHTMGPQRRIISRLPLPGGSDLSVAYLNVNHNADTGRTHFEWELTDTQLGNCSLQYRITVQEAGSVVIEDIYVRTKFLDLRFLSSCTSYQFDVRAINTGHPPSQGPLRSAIQRLPGREQYPPVLIDSNSTISSIFLSFRLESQVRNPCPLRQLYLDGGSQISQTIALSYEDRRSPVNVTIENLNPSTTYNLQVYVSNTAGWSKATNVTVWTLPIIE